VEDPETSHDVNVNGTLTVLDGARGAGVRRVIFAASSSVYGNRPESPKHEQMVLLPVSPYAANKASCEHYLGAYAASYGMETLCLRYFNVFGPRQDPGSAYAAAIPIFIHKAVRNEPITIFGDSEQTRDFIYVKDIVAANIYLAEHAELTGVYNVAYGKRQTINDIAKKIIELTNSTTQINYAPPRAGDVKHSQASIDKITAAGFTPGASFDEGLAKTIAFFSQNK